MSRMPHSLHPPWPASYSASRAREQVPSDRLQYLLQLHKPSYAASTSSITVGRITLPLNAPAPTADVQRSRFANTRQTLAVMERVAACVRMVEPVLLVGETGTGKTTVVQQLARSMGKKMLVHNLSEQASRAPRACPWRRVSFPVLCVHD